MARDTAKIGACVFWITAKAAACFQKGFTTFITYNIVFIDFCVKHFDLQFLYEMCFINKVLLLLHPKGHKGAKGESGEPGKQGHKVIYFF